MSGTLNFFVLSFSVNGAFIVILPCAFMLGYKPLFLYWISMLDNSFNVKVLYSAGKLYVPATFTLNSNCSVKKL